MARAESDADAAARQLETLEKSLDASRKRERALEERSARVGAEMERLQRELVAAATTIQGRETEVAALEARLVKIDSEVAAKETALAEQRARLAGTLAVLQRLALYPRALLIAAPADPNDVLRSALLLRTIVPRLDEEAAALRTELDSLAALERAAARERSALRTAALDLSRTQSRLKGLLEEKSRLVEQTEEEKQREAERIARLAREAESLKELMQEIARQSLLKPVIRPPRDAPRQRPAEVRSFAGSKKGMRPPVRGAVERRFGEQNEFGRPGEGIVIAARAGAQVVAPFDGRVVFAGPFRGYGQILIIEHGGGYHTLLAGFSRIDSVPDQWLLAGEPVGVMGRPGDGAPSLYVELRENGRPIDPLPWLAASN